jgi:hypothetical protein
MNDEASKPHRSKRGRKPIGARAMSTAERQRQSRARKANEGFVEFNVRVGGGMLHFIDQMAAVHVDSRSQMVELLLDLGIAKFLNAFVESELMKEKGASVEEAATFLHEQLSTTPRVEAVQKFKEVMGIK